MVRPNVPDDLAARIREQAAAAGGPIAADELSFKQQLRVVLNQNEELRQKVSNLKEENERLQKLSDRDSGGSRPSTSGASFNR